MANKHRGFTVPEVLIAVAILGIIVVMMLGLSAKILPRWDLRGFARKFVTSVYKARNIALKEERNVWIEFKDKKYIIKVKIDDKDKILEENLIPDELYVEGDTANPIMITPDGRFYVDMGASPQIKLIMFQFSNKYGDKIIIKIYPLGSISLKREF